MHPRVLGSASNTWLFHSSPGMIYWDLSSCTAAEIYGVLLYPTQLPVDKHTSAFKVVPPSYELVYNHYQLVLSLSLYMYIYIHIRIYIYIHTYMYVWYVYLNIIYMIWYDMYHKPIREVEVISAKISDSDLEHRRQVACRHLHPHKVQLVGQQFITW